MKVLHVIPSVAPRYGGPSQAVAGMAAACAGSGIESVIATTNADGRSNLPYSTGERVAYNAATTIFFERQFSEAYKYSRPLAVWLNTHVREFDVVHIHAVFSHSSIAAGHACRRAGVPYVLRPLGTLDPWSLRQKRFRKWIVWHAAARSLVRNAAVVHFTTADEYRLAQSVIGTTRGSVIPLGVHLPDSAPGTKDNYILSIGRLHPKKNLELLIDAFATILAAGDLGSEWRLLIAGDGNPTYVRTLRQRAEAGCPGRVEFAGWTDGEHKHRLLNSAALFAMVSFQENFGLAALEALAHGVPVLLSDTVNLAPEVADAAVGWVSSASVESLATRLREALVDEGERKRRGNAARAFAEQFAWPVVARRLQDLYRTVAVQ